MKTWEKPKLIVLVRGKPEESILSVCKRWEGPSIVPITAAQGCAPIFPGGGCYGCDTASDS
jgi:hypothetical protein